MLKKLPFSNCNDYIDPEPYITACTQTLCNYPPVDRLSCQFLEAYARACSLHTDVDIEPWRDIMSCCKTYVTDAVERSQMNLVTH